MRISARCTKSVSAIAGQEGSGLEIAGAAEVRSWSDDATFDANRPHLQFAAIPEPSAALDDLLVIVLLTCIEVGNKVNQYLDFSIHSASLLIVIRTEAWGVHESLKQHPFTRPSANSSYRGLFLLVTAFRQRRH